MLLKFPCASYEPKINIRRRLEHIKNCPSSRQVGPPPSVLKIFATKYIFRARENTSAGWLSHKQTLNNIVDVIAIVLFEIRIIKAYLLTLYYVNETQSLYRSRFRLHARAKVQKHRHYCMLQNTPRDRNFYSLTVKLGEFVKEELGITTVYVFYPISAKNCLTGPF